MEIAASPLEVTGDEREPPPALAPPRAFVCAGEVLWKRLLVIHPGVFCARKKRGQRDALDQPPPPPTTLPPDYKVTRSLLLMPRETSEQPLIS